MWGKLRRAITGRTACPAANDESYDSYPGLSSRCCDVSALPVAHAMSVPDSISPIALEVILFELRGAAGRVALLHGPHPPHALFSELSRRSGRCILVEALGACASLCEPSIPTGLVERSLLPRRILRYVLRLPQQQCDSPPPVQIFTVETSSNVGGSSTAPLRTRLQQLVSHRIPVAVEGLALQPSAADVEHRGGDVTSAFSGCTSSRGVDATGLVREWPCERILAAALVSWAARPDPNSPSHSEIPSLRLLDGLRVIELGAGSSGLAGLALCSAARGTEVLLTDGHPEAARALARNVCLNTPGGTFAVGMGFSSGPSSSSVQSDCLVFDASAAATRVAAGQPMYATTPLHSSAIARSIASEANDRQVDSRETSAGRDASYARILGDDGARVSRSLDGAFHLAIAADILFFEGYHTDLLHALAVLLSPCPSASVRGSEPALPGGTCKFDVGLPRLAPRSRPQAWLLAPSRGGSLERFVGRANSFRLCRICGPHHSDAACCEACELDACWRPFEVEVFPDVAHDLTDATSPPGSLHPRERSSAGTPCEANASDALRPTLVVLRLRQRPELQSVMTCDHKARALPADN